MGVKDLWSILSPSCEKKSLWELEGLTIAIDLSSWIVDSQSIGENCRSVMNMYLRNLFFRTSYLLLLGVKPIFILEGRAPTIKHDTIARRINAAKEYKRPVKNGNRGRLNSLQKKCEELLMSLGVRCYKSKGEAEALCAKLNEQGVVDAVISQDSDCFLYGARTVLRNFTMSPTYTCDMYTMANIDKQLGLGRDKLLAISLLCGCDYQEGISGVGKQSVIKFLATLADHEVLDRLRKWRTIPTMDSTTGTSQLSQEDKLELNMMKKALLDPSFPSEEVISEFLSTEPFDLPDFVWLKPSLPNFMTLAVRLLSWEEDYVHLKFMPLVTRWHLTQCAPCGLELKSVVKLRTVRGVPSYQLLWKYDGVGELTTVEPVDLVCRTYSEQHEAFVKSKQKPKKDSKSRRIKNTKGEIQSLENSLKTLDINEEEVKQPNKKRSKQKPIKGLQTLDKFLFKDIKENCGQQNCELISHSTPIRDEQSQSYHYASDDNEMNSPRRKFLPNKKATSLVNITHDTITLLPDKQSSFNRSLLDTTTESGAYDLSDIVNSIVTRKSCNPAVKIWINNNG